jgi:trk system potassium uptake protein TrkA
MAAKRFVVLGLGAFGGALARGLGDSGGLVTGVDHDEALVESLRDSLHEAIVGDVTDRAVLEALLLDRAEAVFIALSERIDRSILCALHVKDLKAKQIYVRGVSEEHRRILLALGVTKVIYPEVEMARQLADRVAHPNILECFQVDADYAIGEVAVPAWLVGQTLQSAELPRKYRLFVLGLKSTLHQQWEMAVTADHKFTDDQCLLVMGKKTDIAAFAR